MCEFSPRYPSSLGSEKTRKLSKRGSETWSSRMIQVEHPNVFIVLNYLCIHFVSPREMIFQRAEVVIWKNWSSNLPVIHSSKILMDILCNLLQCVLLSTLLKGKFQNTADFHRFIHTVQVKLNQLTILHYTPSYRFPVKIKFNLNLKKY